MKAAISLLLFSTIFFVSCVENKPKESKVDFVESVNVKPILQGQPNFRDLGGYTTSDGKTVKSGFIYRTGELSHITEEDLKKLDSMHISTVINFLTPAEIELKGEDILPEDATTVYLPLNSGNLAMEVQQAVKSGDFDQVPPDQNAQFHKILTRDLQIEYGQFLKELSLAENPIAYHCSHGVHRTGTATAIFLSILGVPWETVREEYLLTNAYREEETALALEKTKLLVAEKKGIDSSKVDMTNIDAFYILEGSYIDATRDFVLEEYGSFENFAINGLGLTAEDIQTLKNTYLE